MSKAYVIIMKGGEYEDSWTRIDSVAMTEDKAKLRIEWLNKRLEVVKELREKAKQFVIRYKLLYPEPVCSNQEYLTLQDKYDSQLKEAIRSFMDMDDRVAMYGINIEEVHHYYFDEPTEIEYEKVEVV